MFDVCRSLPALPLKVHVFMNQRDVVEVAQFVQRLKLAVWDLGWRYLQTIKRSFFFESFILWFFEKWP